MFELAGRTDVEEVLVTPAVIRGERRPRLQLKPVKHTLTPPSEKPAEKRAAEKRRA
jgi:hypothetical protein